MQDIIGQTSIAAATSPWWAFALWGLAGGFIVDGLDYVKLIKKTPESWIQFFALPYVVGVAIRLLIGAVLAVAAGLAGEISAPMGALIVGMTAPLIVARYLESPPTLGG